MYPKTLAPKAKTTDLPKRIARLWMLTAACIAFAATGTAAAGEFEVQAGTRYTLFDSSPYGFLPLDDVFGANASIGYLFNGTTGVNVKFAYAPSISDVLNPSIEIDQYLGGIELTHDFIIWSDIFVPYVSLGGGVSYWDISEVFDSDLGGYVDVGAGLRIFPFDRRVLAGRLFVKVGGSFLVMFNAVGNNDIDVSTSKKEYYGGALDLSVGIRF